MARVVMDDLPGAELVAAGLADLQVGAETDAALLVSIGALRLRALGFDVPEPFDDAEHRLYARLAEQGADAAHGRYNALVRRLVSFERAAACVDQPRRSESAPSCRASGGVADGPTTLYLTGGATAVLLGWRESTVDIDVKLVPDGELLRAVPKLKEELQINVERWTRWWDGTAGDEPAPPRWWPWMRRRCAGDYAVGE